MTDFEKHTAEVRRKQAEKAATYAARKAAEAAAPPKPEKTLAEAVGVKDLAALKDMSFEAQHALAVYLGWWDVDDMPSTPGGMFWALADALKLVPKAPAATPEELATDLEASYQRLREYDEEEETE